MEVPLDTGPITRLTSRAWKRNAIRPPGSLRAAAWRATVQVPASAQALRGRRARRGVCVGLVEARDLGLREAGALAIAGVRLRRLQGPPVGGHLEPHGVDIDEVLIDARAGVHQQLLDHHLDGGVLALAEVVVTDPAVDVGDVHGRPEVVRERAPDGVVAVEHDRVLDAKVRAAAVTLSMSRSKPNSGVWTPMTVRPAAPYFAAQARTYGSVRSQFTHVYVQKSTRTTRPLSPSGCQRLRVQPAGRAIERWPGGPRSAGPAARRQADGRWNGSGRVCWAGSDIVAAPDARSGLRMSSDMGCVSKGWAVLAWVSIRRPASFAEARHTSQKPAKWRRRSAEWRTHHQ